MHDLMVTPEAPDDAPLTSSDHSAYFSIDDSAKPVTIELLSCYTGTDARDDYNAYSVISSAVGRDTATIGCSPGYTVTLLYFMIFLVFCSFILLNLFLAVILQGFQSSSEENTAVLPPAVLKSLKLVWGEIDKKASYHVPSTSVEQLFRRLDQELRLIKTPIPPLGLSGAVLNSSYGVELEYAPLDENSTLLAMHAAQTADFKSLQMALEAERADHRRTLEKLATQEAELAAKKVVALRGAQYDTVFTAGVLAALALK